MYVLVNIDATSKSESTVFQSFDELYSWVLEKNGSNKIEEKVAAGVVSKLQSFLSSLLPHGGGGAAPTPLLPFEQGEPEEHVEEDRDILCVEKETPYVEQQNNKPIRELLPLLKSALGTIEEPYNSQYFNKKISQLRTSDYQMPREMLWLQSGNAMIPRSEVLSMTREIEETYFHSLKVGADVDTESVTETVGSFYPLPKMKKKLKLTKSKYDNLGLEYPPLQLLKSWFINTFCDHITAKDSDDIVYTPISFKACVSLFLNAYEFCTQNPYMISNAVNIPESAVMYLRDYELEPIFAYMTDKDYIIRKGSFNLFFDILKNVRKSIPTFYLQDMPRVVTTMSAFLYENFDNWESLVSETLIKYSADKLDKNALKNWIIPFISKELKQTEGASTKSSEIYGLWNAFLKNTVVGVKDDKFVTAFTDTVSIQQFSKSMKAMGYETMRKSAGMFYQGLEKRGEVIDGRTIRDTSTSCATYVPYQSAEYDTLSPPL